MAEYLSPGVYIEEVEKGPKPIEGVSTSTAAFVGFTEKVPDMIVRHKDRIETKPAVGQPRLVTNWSEYLEQFGGLVEGAYLPYAVRGFFENGGQRCYVISLQEVPAMPAAQKKLLNGQMIVESKKQGIEGTRLRFKLKANGHLPAPEPVAEPPADPPKDGDGKEAKSGSGSKSTAKTAPAEEPTAFTVLVERLEDDARWKRLEQLEDLTIAEEKVENGKTVPKVKYKYDRPSQWIDIQFPKAKPSLMQLYQETGEDWHHLDFEKTQLPAPDVDRLQADQSSSENIGGILETLDDVRIVCVPDLMIPKAGQDEPDLAVVTAVQSMMVSHCEKMGDRVAILDSPPHFSPQEIKEWRLQLPFDTSYAALYYPWLEIQDTQNRTVPIPPSGHLAGIWARTDNARGVHKAPANEELRNITGITANITKGQQDTLNPIGINCIREFPGRGVRIWGARTLSSNPAWRYLNVRRLFNYVETSIERSTQWVVFEPNDPDLWARVSRDVTAFLKTVWRSGALFGLTPEQAFYVKCDEELNPPEFRDLGKLIIEIGLAPVKPAEFVIFRITQWDGQS